MQCLKFYRDWGCNGGLLHADEGCYWLKCFWYWVEILLFVLPFCESSQSADLLNCYSPLSQAQLWFQYTAISAYYKFCMLASLVLDLTNVNHLTTYHCTAQAHNRLYPLIIAIISNLTRFLYSNVSWDYRHPAISRCTLISDPLLTSVNQCSLVLCMFFFLHIVQNVKKEE